MRSLWILVALLGSVFQLVSAQGSNSIIVPPNGFNVTAGQLVTIEWDNPSLRTVTIQLVPVSGIGVITLGSVLPSNGSATLLVPADIPTTQQYTFKITDDSNSSNVHVSPGFTINPPTFNSSPTSPSAASSAGEQPSPTSTDSPSSSSPSSHSGLSTGAIAGIAVGGVLVLAGLAALAAFFVMRRRKHEKWQQQQEQSRQQQQQQQQQQHLMAPYGAEAPPYDNRYSNPAGQVASPVKNSAQLPNDGAGRSWREPSEVSGSRTFPREMEGTSRFQSHTVAELPADGVVR